MIFMHGLASAGRLASDSFLANVKEILNVLNGRTMIIMEPWMQKWSILHGERFGDIESVKV